MSLQKATETAVQQCMGLESNESCIIVTDDNCKKIANVLYQAASDISKKSSIICMPPAERDASEPPAAVAAAMQTADVVLAPTTESITHTKARIAATNKGSRVATLPGITEEVFINGLNADYTKIKRECDQLFERVNNVNKIRITAENGTDITFDLGDRKWLKDTGLARKHSHITNLPAGEIFVSPTTAEGTYVVDGTMKPHDLINPGDEIEIKVKEGYVTSISDDKLRNEIESVSETAGKDAKNIAELGLGTNTSVKKLTGAVLLDEKAAGTVHIAIGDDSGFGGNTEVPIHMDGVIQNPTVYADGEEIELPVPEKQ